MENNQEEPNVLIARNNETGQIGAVTGQNPDGSPKNGRCEIGIVERPR